MKTLVITCLALSLTGCVSTPEHTHLSAPDPLFSPAEFFSGRTTGEGQLNIIFGAAEPIHVTGNGHVEADGTLVLVQRIQRGDDAPTIRTWRIRPAGGERYSGTLTSAQGPVAGEVSGNRLHLRFTADGGLDTEQWLYLEPGGRAALNRMVVRKFGLPVAALEETIRKTD